jgi:isorenieratene synthase
MERSSRRVVVVGGGLAGLAAATVLAERGVEVVVIEKERYLGGRAGSWSDRLADGTPFEMERGFHGFFRQYKNLRALIRRVDPSLSSLMPLDDYPLLGPGGASQSFSKLPTTPILNIVELIRRSPSIRVRDLLGADLLRAGSMLAFDVDRSYLELDGTSADVFLDGLRFPPEARRMLFEVFAHSFFNPEEDYSAAELLAMFHYYFTRNPDGLVFDVMRDPFGVVLFEPLERYLRERGVRFAMGTAASAIAREADGGWRVDATFHADRSLDEAGLERDDRGVFARGDAVVLATTVPALRAITQASPHMAAVATSIESLDVTLPFAVWRMWLDRPCLAERAPFAGTAGLGLLDNISLYERFEGESRRWAERTGGSVVELHAYAVPEHLSEADIRADLLRGMHEAYPETRDATVLEERFLLRRDCPSFRPGSHADRPGVETPLGDVVLAGDFVKLPFPSALMERATSSGFLAANVLLERWGRRGVAVEHGPTKGILPAALSRFA